ncbi:MAG: YfiM family protein [Sphingobacteriales bacterium]|jgi:hypothetical protein|nr:YfiM family protein [Sphingobacteriales bacterium]
MMRKAFSLLLLLLVFNVSFSQDSVKINKPRLILATSVQGSVLIGGIAGLNYIWYEGHEKLGFHFYNNDGNEYLMIDKLGHAFSAYQESAIAYHSLRWAGVSKKRALLFGGPMGLILQTPIELFDAMYDGYGFSKNDMIANFTGSALFTFQELFWDEQIIKPKFSYSPSPYRDYYPRRLGDTQLKSFFLDYNAHTYWLSFPANKIICSEKTPKWLNIAVGYSANGMFGEFENPATTNLGVPIPHFDRYRQFLLSVDVDLTKIPTKSKGLKVVFNVLNRIKIPAPTLEYNSLGKFKGYGLYF